MAIASYARGIPTYKGENGQTIGLLCETKEQCITDDDGVRLSDKLQSIQQQIGEGPDFTGYATETFVDNAVSGLASTQYVDTAVSDKATTAYVDAAVSNAGGGGDADTLDGHNASYFATAESVANIVNGTTTVGKASVADTATNATTADTATRATTADSATTAGTATRATTADNATKATTADSASKATADGNGNNIADTYFTKSGVVVLDTDPGIGASVSYPNGTFLFVKGA